MWSARPVRLPPRCAPAPGTAMASSFRVIQAFTQFCSLPCLNSQAISEVYTMSRFAWPRSPLAIGTRRPPASGIHASSPPPARGRVFKGTGLIINPSTCVVLEPKKTVFFGNKRRAAHALCNLSTEYWSARAVRALPVTAVPRARTLASLFPPFCPRTVLIYHERLHVPHVLVLELCAALYVRFRFWPRAIGLRLNRVGDPPAPSPPPARGRIFGVVSWA
jgi:hypothetical protein